MGDITVLLRKSNDGDNDSRAQLFRALYSELHRLARSQLYKANPVILRGSLDTTSLLHESYLKLVNVKAIDARDRSHFFAYAAKTMRSVILDLVRERMTDRRGSVALSVTLNTNVIESVAQKDEDWLRINEALDQLAAVDERLVQVVEMRFFAGFTEKEIADILGVSDRTVKRDWEKARLLLMAELS
jgi:RNA polymerase sigma factor (TIGR02999 family)